MSDWKITKVDLGASIPGVGKISRVHITNTETGQKARVGVNHETSDEIPEKVGVQIARGNVYDDDD